MIELNLTSKHGNAASRRFPHHGYFGVTDVELAGAAHIKIIPGADPIPIRSVKLAVRCYEVRMGGPLRASQESVLWDQVHTLWLPPDGLEEVTLGDWSTPFHITIPPEAAEHARGSQTLREWKTLWRIEFIVDHRPIPVVGHRAAHRYSLDLYDHRTLPVALPSPSSPMIVGSGSSAVHVSVNAPAVAVGPADTFAVSVSVRPEDASTSVRKLQIILDRRLELLDDKRTSPTPDEGKSRISTIFNRGVSPRPSRGSDDRVTTARVAETTCDLSSASSSGAVWSMGELTIPRRSQRWDIGATQRTSFVDISFELYVKATLKTKRGTTKELISPAVPVVVVGSTSEERSHALRCVSDPVSSGSSRAASTNSRDRSASRESRRKLYTLDDADLADSTPATPGFARSPTPSDVEALVSPRDQSRETLPFYHLHGSPFSSASDHGAHLRARRVSDEGEADPAGLPPRARPKLEPVYGAPLPGMFEPSRKRRTVLPSLDALGLGLPRVDREPRRPRTAPAWGRAATAVQGRPSTSGGAFAFR